MWSTLKLIKSSDFGPTPKPQSVAGAILRNRSRRETSAHSDNGQACLFRYSNYGGFLLSRLGNHPPVFSILSPLLSAPPRESKSNRLKAMRCLIDVCCNCVAWAVPKFWSSLVFHDKRDANFAAGPSLHGNPSFWPEYFRRDGGASYLCHVTERSSGPEAMKDPFSVFSSNV